MAADTCNRCLLLCGLALIKKIRAFDGTILEHIGLPCEFFIVGFVFVRVLQSAVYKPDTADAVAAGIPAFCPAVGPEISPHGP